MDPDVHDDSSRTLAGWPIRVYTGKQATQRYAHTQPCWRPVRPAGPTIAPRSRSGGMADAGVSKTPVRKGVWVRIPPSAPPYSCVRWGVRVSLHLCSYGRCLCRTRSTPTTVPSPTTRWLSTIEFEARLGIAQRWLDFQYLDTTEPRAPRSLHRSQCGSRSGATVRAKGTARRCTLSIHANKERPAPQRDGPAMELEGSDGDSLRVWARTTRREAFRTDKNGSTPTSGSVWDVREPPSRDDPNGPNAPMLTAHDQHARFVELSDPTGARKKSELCPLCLFFHLRLVKFWSGCVPARKFSSRVDDATLCVESDGKGCLHKTQPGGRRRPGCDGTPSAYIMMFYWNICPCEERQGILEPREPGDPPPPPAPAPPPVPTTPPPMPPTTPSAKPLTPTQRKRRRTPVVVTAPSPSRFGGIPLAPVRSKSESPSRWRPPAEPPAPGRSGGVPWEPGTGPVPPWYDRSHRPPAHGSGVVAPGCAAPEIRERAVPVRASVREAVGLALGLALGLQSGGCCQQHARFRPVRSKSCCPGIGSLFEVSTRVLLEELRSAETPQTRKDSIERELVVRAPASIPLIVDGLRTAGPTPARLMSILARLERPTRAVVPALMPVLESDDESATTRRRVSAVTGMIGAAAAPLIPSLIRRILNAPPREWRPPQGRHRGSTVIAYRLALGRIGLPAVGPVSDLLAHNDWSIVVEALATLGEVGAPSLAADERIVRVLAAPSEKVRWQAFHTLNQIGFVTPRLRASAAAAAKSDESPAVRAAAAKTQKLPILRTPPRGR